MAARLASLSIDIDIAAVDAGRQGAVGIQCTVSKAWEATHWDHEKQSNTN